MSYSKVLALSLFVFAPLMASAHSTNGTAQATSCSADPIQEFLCPDGSGQYNQYFDAGCQVTCAAGQTPSCTQATCAPDESGEEIPSSCTCN